MQVIYFMNGKAWLVLGALLGAGAVVSGAYHAHGLEKKLESVDAEERAKRLDHGSVAVRYHMYHSLGMLAVGMLALQFPARIFHVGATFWCGGLLCFCGSLYISSFQGI